MIKIDFHYHSKEVYQIMIYRRYQDAFMARGFDCPGVHKRFTARGFRHSGWKTQSGCQRRPACAEPPFFGTRAKRVEKLLYQVLEEDAELQKKRVPVNSSEMS